MQIDGLDELDNKILSVIKNDARLSYSEIGEKVGVSRVCVKNRMAMMEQKGVIEGYYTKINLDSVTDGTRFFVEVVTQPDQFEQVVDRIASKGVIRRVYAVSGDCRFIAEGVAPNRSTYEVFLRNLRLNLTGVRSITVTEAQYAIKNTYGGVDYVSLEQRKNRKETEDNQENQS